MTSEENRYKNYQDKEPMSPENELTAVKRDPNDQEIQKADRQILIQNKQKRNIEKKIWPKFRKVKPY